MQVSATIIADSISEAGDRLTTVEAVMHRDSLAELNTHRDFSRNSASSRAIPFPKLVQRVIDHPALPSRWTLEQKGMQGAEGIDEETQALAEREWLLARDRAIFSAGRLAALGIHKQHVNRLLEPYMWHTVIITSTRWDNFFEQRCSRLAYPNIEELAYKINSAYELSKPVEREIGDWHLPYIDKEERADYTLANLVRISAMRCARVSYLTHDGVRSPEADLAGYWRLKNAEPPHWSPMEHPAMPVSNGLQTKGNFDGWAQLRHLPVFQ